MADKLHWLQVNMQPSDGSRRAQAPRGETYYLQLAFSVSEASVIYL